MRFLRVREERGRLITATRLSITDHNEFKRGREYPLLVVSGSVSRGAWIRCASEDWRILYHEGRSHKRIEKENYRTLLCSAWANQIDRAKKRRRPRAPFIYPHWTNGEAERTVCQWKSRQREIETSAGIFGIICATERMSVSFYLFLLNCDANVSLQNGTRKERFCWKI